MKWKQPPVIKIYEALGAVADGRVEASGDSAKVYSSSGKKFYEVTYNPEKNEIMSNDNGSYWKGYLGYPAIAFLMKVSAISYDQKLANLLKGVAWKDINQKFKNNFDKTLKYILEAKTKEEHQALESLVNKINGELMELGLSYLGKKVLPPEGY